MKTPSALLTMVLTLAWLPAALAQEGRTQTEFEEAVVHHTVFPSTALKADIASQYDLVRGKDYVLVNVAVLRHNATGGGMPATVKGTAANLMQQQTRLDFKPIEEGDAFYYIAPLRVTDEEVFHFDIEVDPRGPLGPYTIEFSKKLYTNE